eukprot:gene39379-47934_t
MEEKEEPSTGHIGSNLSFFGEKQQVLEWLQSLCMEEIPVRREQLLESLDKTLIKYQEQPQLLGPHIESLMDPVNAALVDLLGRSDNLSAKENLMLLHISKFIQLLCRIRGFKQVAKHLPHEVHQLEPCCLLLTKQNKESYDSWETRYALLLWLSSLVLIPFDLTSMDSQTQGASLIQLLISVAMSFLDDSGPTREAAGFCLANLFTRPDMEAQHLESFLRSTAVVLQRRVDSKSASNNREYFEYIGMLSCLNQIFKRGHRSKLVPLIHLVYANATNLASTATQTIERKLLCKLIQRLGMTFLPPKEASWRYQRGQRSLMSNLNKSSTAALSTDRIAQSLADDDEESVSFPDELEDIIGLIISFLSDKDTVVRWSAAKGVGRITMRLTKALAADVLQAVLSLFEDASADMNWHGGCLAIAELSRRGLLLPEQLGPVVEVINQGMRFDLLRGQHSVGAHVRDAACYVCWAFARAYTSTDLASFGNSLFENMLVTSLFDREVNCRRAASAALQEFVGRQ